MSVKNVKQSPSYPFMTKRAADCMADSIEKMVQKLCRMDHVEYICEDKTLPMNYEDNFRDLFVEALETELESAVRKFAIRD